MFRQVTTGLLVGASLALAACTTAPAPAVQASSSRATDSATRTTGTKVAANNPDKKICRREIATGSVMAKAVCRTRTEWARQSGSGTAEKDLLDAQQRAAGTVSGARGN